MNIVEENIVHGHYVETDFRHYSQLVRTLVKKTRELNGDQAIFFTALCLPPYQWFNFSAGRSIKTAKKVADIQEVIEADPVWVLYLEFIYELAKERTNIWRCVFNTEDGFKHRSCFKDLVESNVIESQLNSYIILPKKTEEFLQPLENNNIKSILGETIKNKYKCYEDARKAYLIVDEEMSVGEQYIIKKVRDFFSVFQMPGQRKTWTYKNKHELSSLPEDFFLVGKGQSLDNAEWQFGLTADVAEDLKKVRLWFISDKLHACERTANDKYHERFNFDDIKAFLKNILIKEME